MPLITYERKNFRGSTLSIIEQANEIIDEYTAQGYALTLRQLYYQFVARGLIANKQREYKRLGSIINDGRLAGYIDWDAIEDRTRNLASNSHWSSPAEIIEICAGTFRFDLWENQPRRVEVWVEKEALSGVFDRVCRELDVPYFSCRGYVSQSELWPAAMRLQRYEAQGQETVILHFGDHDPSGIDMTRDVDDRMSIFGSTVAVERLALNMPQVEQYDPPPNPAKTSDSRFESYISRYGDESWELDALEPSVLSELVRDRVRSLRDETIWNEDVERQQEARRQLTAISENFEQIAEEYSG